VSNQGQYMTWFVDKPADYSKIWNGQAYTEDFWVRDLKFVAQRYAHLPRFIGIDVYNEPNSIVRWSTGDANTTDPKYFWKAAVEKAAAGILQSNPKLLIFVQGINGNWDGIENSNMPMNWGEDFQPQAYQPLNVPAGKLVLSPHTYGPDVFVKSSFSASNFPANLAADWETLFGQFSSQVPVVVGEWGGRYGQGGVGQADVTWQNAFVDYLLSKGIRSSFYWCYTPNSGDTGGILDDNLNVRQDKLALLQRHWGSVSSGSTLALSTATYTVSQGAGSLSVTVNRSGNTSAAASVNYATANGTAIAGTHYTAASGTLNWAAGSATATTLSIPISNAAPFTGSKSFSIALSNAGSGSVIGTPATATITVNGSAVAAPGTLALSASSYTVAQTAGSLTVSVSRTGGSGGAISVQYATVDGTARAGSDYSSSIGTVAWASGDSSAKTFTVPISSATPFSGSRSFTIRLSNAGGGATQGSPDTTSVTINGSAVAGAPGSFALTASTYTVAQDGGLVKVTVNRASGSTGAVSIRYATANGSARSGADYNGKSGVLNWASGDATPRTFSIAIRTTAPYTGSRSFTVSLSNPTGGALQGAPQSATVTITGSKTVTPTTYAQPYIISFSPAAGTVGTVVTLTGSGFTGANAAWAGNAHNATVTVISDTQLRVTIPVGATTGAIGIFNPLYVSFTASSFTVQ